MEQPYSQGRFREIPTAPNVHVYGVVVAKKLVTTWCLGMTHSITYHIRLTANRNSNFQLILTCNFALPHLSLTARQGWKPIVNLELQTS